MSSSDTRLLPEPIQRALRALEARVLVLVLLQGAGRLAVVGSALLGALYSLDRLFEPPRLVRIVLTLCAAAVLQLAVRRVLVRPLRLRPSPRDLAAWYEHRHPELQDRLATAVELTPPPPGISAELVAVVAAEAAGAAAGLDARADAPGGRALRNAGAGALAAGLLAFLAARAPHEAGIFLSRLLGGASSWPRDTQLVLLPPRVEGALEPPPLREVARESFRLQVASGAVVTLRVRAEGVVPEIVFASGAAGERPMRPLGGGEFVLRLPPLERPQRWTFRGGDDSDGLPRLELEPGLAPAVVEWSVEVAPPAYTRQPSEVSPLNEFRVPEGTELRARFRADPPAARATARTLQGDPQGLAPGPDGFYELDEVARGSGEAVVALEGPDGFVDARAAVLRWLAVPDRPPRLEFVLPAESWTTVDGGRYPVLLSAVDEYELGAVVLRNGEGAALALSIPEGARELRHFEVREAGLAAGAEPGSPRRLRLEAEAEDRSEPAPHAARAQSPWIEVLPPDLYEERLASRMGEVRQRVERLRDAARSFLSETPPEAEDPASRARRLRRDLEALQGELERILAERLFSRLDRGADASLEGLLQVYRRGVPEVGAVTAALSDAGATPPLERSGLVLNLARSARAARVGPAEDLMEAASGGADPAPAAAELTAQLDAMLEVLLEWEDFQSALNLLRALLERQQSLYLRTQEASGR